MFCWCGLVPRLVGIWNCTSQILGVGVGFQCHPSLRLCVSRWSLFVLLNADARCAFSLAAGRNNSEVVRVACSEMAQTEVPVSAIQRVQVR